MGRYRRTCSDKCRYLLVVKSQKENQFENQAIQCKQCNKEIISRDKNKVTKIYFKKGFCTRNCQKRFEQPIIVCENCGTKFQVKQCEAGKRKHCSMNCYNISKRGKLVIPNQCGSNNGNWNPNKISRTYPSRLMKEDVRNRDQNRCYVCHTLVNLHVHHAISYDELAKRNEPRHKRENLLTLCHDCHWKVHNGVYGLTSGIPNTNYPDGRYAVWMFQ